MALWTGAFGIKIQLRNGDLYQGVLSGEQKTVFILQTDSGEVMIRKESVVAIDGVPFSSLQPEAGTQPGVRPLANSGETKRKPSEKPEIETIAETEWIVVLKNGSEFRGKPVRQNQRLLVLQTRSTPLTLFKNVIASIDSSGNQTNASTSLSGSGSFETKRNAVSRKPVAVSAAVTPPVSGSKNSSLRHQKRPLPPTGINGGGEVPSGGNSSAAQPDKGKNGDKKGTVTVANPAPRSDEKSAVAETPAETDSVSEKTENASDTTRLVPKKLVTVVTLSGEDLAIEPTPASTPSKTSSNQEPDEVDEPSPPSTSDVQNEAINLIRPLRTPGMGVMRKQSAQRQMKPAAAPADTVAQSLKVPDSESEKRSEPVAAMPAALLPLPLPSDSIHRDDRQPAAATEKTVVIPKAGPAASSSAPIAVVKPVQKVPPLITVTPASGADQGEPERAPAQNDQPVATSERPDRQQPQTSPAPPMEQTPAPVKRTKRTDGRSELVLLDSTEFIGKILFENERSIVLDVDGASLTILKTLIRSIDGVAYDRAADGDTLLQLSLTRKTGAKVTVPETESAAPNVLFRVMPRTTIPDGVTAESISDSLSATTDWKVRSRAARYIGAMGPWGVAMTPAVARLLGDTAQADDPVPDWLDSQSVEPLLAPGLEAARALAQLGARGESELLAACNHTEPLMRRNGVFGLGNSFFETTEKTVKSMIPDPDPRVRRAALGSLRMPSALPFLVKAGKDTDPGVRSTAATLLGRIGSGDAAAQLATMCKDGNAAVRRTVAVALGSIGIRESVEPLRVLCSDTDHFVRAAAIRALGATKDTGAVTVLLEALKNPAGDVRSSAAEALGLLRDSRSIPALYAAVKDVDPLVREKAQAALKNHTDLPLLFKALDDPSPVVRGNAGYLLWLLTGKDLGPEREKWEHWAAAGKKKNGKSASGKQ